METGSDDTSLGLTPAGTSHYRQLREKEKEKDKEKGKEKEKEEGKESLVVGDSGNTTGGVAGSSVVAGAGVAVSNNSLTPGSNVTGNGPSPGPPAVTTHNPGAGAHATEIAGVEVILTN